MGLICARAPTDWRCSFEVFAAAVGVEVAVVVDGKAW
jgi:hypothetical protein